MEAKDAVKVAKDYFEELFSEKGTLEEIWFDTSDGAWCVTLGVKRPPSVSSIGMMALGAHLAMAYKVVRIRDKDGKPISVRNREGERAA
jgi:hypothetical protein